MNEISELSLSVYRLFILGLRSLIKYYIELVVRPASARTTNIHNSDLITFKLKCIQKQSIDKQTYELMMEFLIHLTWYSCGQPVKSYGLQSHNIPYSVFPCFSEKL